MAKNTCKWKIYSIGTLKVVWRLNLYWHMESTVNMKYTQLYSVSMRFLAWGKCLLWRCWCRHEESIVKTNRRTLLARLKYLLHCCYVGMRIVFWRQYCANNWFHLTMAIIWEMWLLIILWWISFTLYRAWLHHSYIQASPLKEERTSYRILYTGYHNICLVYEWNKKTNGACRCTIYVWWKQGMLINNECSSWYNRVGQVAMD